MSEKLASHGDWYCRNCGYLDCSRVTFSETCDTYHQPVEWHTNEQQDKIETIRNETIEECIDELILLQGHYTQEQINADKIALFWTRGVHRSIEKLRALSEDQP